MIKLLVLLNLFDNSQLLILTNLLEEQNNLVSKLILLLVKNRNWSDKEFISALKISGNTFNKICTQAKDYLLLALERNVDTPIDGIYVIQKIIFSGEIEFAQKLLNDLEKEMERKQLWLNLEFLHIEASRIYYTNGNLSASVKLMEKRDKNSARLTKYINLNSSILNEMIRLEGFKSRKPDLNLYHKKIIALKVEAFALNHHVLIHNALHLNYMFASRYSQKAKLVHAIILDMEKNMKKFYAVMHPFSKAVINNTHLNFLTIYNGFGNPEEFVRKVKKSIYAAGKVLAANMCYAMLEFYLYEKNIPKVMDWLNELESIEDNSKFKQYKHIILAIKGFIENDAQLFKKHFAEFYCDSSHLDFPDMEVNLRIIELLLLMKHKDDYLLESKIVALKKYMSRNVNKDRYGEEGKIVLLIEKRLFGKKNTIVKGIKELSKSDYRNIVFLEKCMSSMME